MSLWQIIDIEFINLSELKGGIFHVGGKVKKSNFIEAGKKTLMPIFASKSLGNLSIFDIIKITFYTHKDTTGYHDTENGKTAISFKNCGTRYELWNEQAQGWDKVFEILKQDA